MTESDSDVEFQSADEGEEEIVKEKHLATSDQQKQPDTTNDQKQPDTTSEQKQPDTTRDQKQPDTSDKKQPDTTSDQRQPDTSEQKQGNTAPNTNQSTTEEVKNEEEIDNAKVASSEVDTNVENDPDRVINAGDDLTSEKQTTSNKFKTTVEESSSAEVENANEEDAPEIDNKVSDDVSDPPGDQVIGRQADETPQVDANLGGGDAERSNLQSPLDRLSEKSAQSSGGWGWGGWGKSLISSATSTVSGLGHGLSSAIQSVESSLGVPQPEEIAIEETSANKAEEKNEDESLKNDDKKEESGQNKENEVKEEEREVETEPDAVEEASSGYSLLSYGASAFSGVVGKTVSGGLGALELIGKKTMDVIQDGDPGLRRKREYFTKGNMPSLSQSLKEAAEEAEQEALKEEEDEERNRAHFGILFDKYQGLSHLEALEILSNQSEGKVHSVMATVTGEELDNLKTQMIEIKDAFKLQDMDVEEEDYETATFVDTITEHLFTLTVAATPDKLKRVQREAHEWLARCKQELETMKEIKQKERIEMQRKEEEKQSDDLMNIKDDTADERTVSDSGNKVESKEDEAGLVKDTAADEADTDTKQGETEENIELKEYLVPKEIHVKAIQTLAELTSRCIEQFHKAAELMLLQQAKEHAKNPIQRAASLSKLTSVLCCEVSSLTSRFSEQLTVAADTMGVTEDDVNPLITNSYLEGSNSMSYIQDAFQLLLPVLQVVAIEYEQ